MFRFDSARECTASPHFFWRRARITTLVSIVAVPWALAAGAFADESTVQVPGEPAVVLAKEGVKFAYPRFSSDGRRFLFQSNESGKWRICLMDRDGSNRATLTSGEANDYFADWSPDGKRIAFTSDRDGDEDVFVMNADGSDPKNLTKNPARDIHPYWSQDGSKILFNSTRDVERLQIYQMNPDGSDTTRLISSDDDDTCARVSPDGKSILYLTNLLAARRDDVIVSRRDGTAPENVTNDAARDGWPTWTADGQRIVYSSARDGSFGLFVIGAKGGEKKRLTAPPAGTTDARAHVAPTNDAIVFNRESGNSIGIYLLKVDLDAS